jgi:hypothetical protein
MWMRTAIAMTTAVAFGCASTATADAHRLRHHGHARVVPYALPAEPAPHSPYYGGRLVYHPAHNIACDTVYRSTRDLPCDQPVWVYGAPCEIDLGRGRYRSCD